MRRTFILLFLLFAAVFGVSWSPVEMVPAFKNLRADVADQLYDLLGREVTIESVSGSILNQIELNNVAIAKGKKLSDGAIIRAKKIVINYSPVKLAASRGNIIPAITKISVIEPDIVVERSIDDKWNMAELIPTVKADNDKDVPLTLNAVIDIKSGRGIYLDHMGWGELLNGRVFTSGIRDMDFKVKISGPRISIQGRATSVIGGDTAYAEVKGDINTKNGKYHFVVNAKDVEVERWAYYTMNVPHFKALSGKSDMVLTMTNPPPRKKGQPVLFDGKFYIRGGKANIFENLFEDIYGSVHIYDEDVRFKNVAGKRDGLQLVANGRLHDFLIANYDIDIDVPSTDFEIVKRPIPQLSWIDFKGKVSGRLHIGGNYGHPSFRAKIEPSGSLFSQPVKGNLNLLYEETVLNILPSSLSALGGQLYASGIADFTTGLPGISMTLTSEAIDINRIFPGLGVTERFGLKAHLFGNPERLSFDAEARGTGQKSIDLLGKLVEGAVSVDISGKDIPVRGGYYGGNVGEFKGKIAWAAGKFDATAASIEGTAVVEKAYIGPEEISRANISIRYAENKLDMAADMVEGISVLNVTASSAPENAYTFRLRAVSAEAGDIRSLNAVLPAELVPVKGLLNADITGTFALGLSGTPDVSGMRATGCVTFENGHLSFEKIDSAFLDFDATYKGIHVKNSVIRSGDTDLSWSGTIEPGERLDIDFDGAMDLGILKPFTIKYGRLFGKTRIAGQLHGPFENPAFDGAFAAKELRYNEIFIDQVSGNLSYDGKTLLAESPIKMRLKNDEYELSGRLDMKKVPAFSIKFEVKKGDLNTAVGLIDEANKELSGKRFFPTTGEASIVLDPAFFRFPFIFTRTLYTTEGKPSLSEKFNEATADSIEYAKEIMRRDARRMEGKFSGRIDMKGTLQDTTGFVDFRIQGATIESYRFEEAEIKGGFEKGAFEVESLYLKKRGGIISVKGRFNPAGQASLEVTASAMPVDFLSLIVPVEKTFEGTFDMNAALSGTSVSRTGWSNIKARDFFVGGVSMDDVVSSIRLSEGNILIDDISLIKDGKRTHFSGIIPLEGEGMNVSAILEGEGIGLLTMPVNGLEWISGNGKGSISITGSLDHPVMNGRVSIEGTSVNVALIDSTLAGINSSIRIDNNLLTTESIEALWIGARTRDIVNKLNASGSLDLNGIFGKERAAFVDIKLESGAFIVDLTDLYNGDIRLRRLSLAGPVSFTDRSINPKLSCDFDIYDGVISLPDFSKKTRLPNMALEMRINIGKNTYIVAGDVKNLISTDISNLLLNMEIEGENIQVAGTLDSPMITGKTLIKHGTMNIFNREFTLMSVDRQKEIYPADLEKIKDNTAVFSGGAMPNLNLAAEVDVKETEVVGSPGPGEAQTYKTTEYLVVSRITGIPFSDDKDKGLKLDFDAFIQDRTKQPPDLVLSEFDQEDIKVLLLPDYIKGPLKIDQKGVGEVDAGVVLADYFNSRLNTYLLRDLERKLAKTLELESLTLEYNFGKDIKNLLPSRTPAEIAAQGAPETMYGIGAVKGFFERFYMEVKYAQAVQDQAVINNALLNYQLTYKLSPIVSVVYYREPFSFIEDQSNYYKVTLKLGYQL